MSFRRNSRTDHLLAVVDQALNLDNLNAAVARANPAQTLTSPEPTAHDRRLVAGLMRINHTGEVCAQALYLGQAAVAESADTRAHLLQSAREEHDHLVWCDARLREIDARPSLLNPLWFAGSYLIGAGAALFGDRVSLGFVVETERQVEQHLEGHLDRLPAADQASLAIVRQMKDDEASHALQAEQAGAAPLPAPLRVAMRAAAKVMTTTAHYI